MVTKIAVDYWSPHWGWEPHDDSAANAVLSEFKRKINRNDIIQVDVPLCSEVIMEAGDTACGPDGIPFSVYKSLVSHTAPLLCDSYHYAANNNPAPPGTNDSLLHLIRIPKPKVT